MWEAITLASRLFLILVGVVGIGILIYLLNLVSAVLVPLFVAIFIVILTNPIISWVEGKGMSRKWGTILFILFFFLSLFSIVTLVLIQLTDFAIQLPLTLDKAANEVNGFWLANGDSLKNINEQVSKLGIDWSGFVSSYSSNIGSIITSIVSKVGLVFSLVIVPLYVFYLLIESKNIEKNWKTYLPLPPKSWVRTETEFVLGAISGYTIAFIRGQVMVSFVSGILIGLGLSIIGLNYSLLFGFMMAVFGIIPFVGLILTLIPAILVAIFQSGSLSYVLLVLAVFLVTNFFGDYYLSPKIQGNRTGLHPLVILLSILIWPKIIGGMLGVLLAVPLTATLFVLIDRYIWKYDLKK